MDNALKDCGNMLIMHICVMVSWSHSNTLDLCHQSCQCFWEYAKWSLWTQPLTDATSTWTWGSTFFLSSLYFYICLRIRPKILRSKKRFKKQRFWSCWSLQDATPSLSYPTAHTFANMKSDDYWACAAKFTKPNQTKPMPAFRFLL